MFPNPKQHLVRLASAMTIHKHPKHILLHSILNKIKHGFGMLKKINLFKTNIEMPLVKL